MNRPWKNSLIAKFFLSYVGIVLLLFSSFFFYSGTAVRRFYLSSLTQKMEGEAGLLGRLLPSNLQGDALDVICRTLAGDLGIRVTVIAADGKVLGDSDEPSVTMENHGSRPEVIQALSEGTGQSLRFSTTVGYEMLYHAWLQDGGPSRRVIRVAVPLEDVDEVVGRLRQNLFLGLLVVSLAGLALAFLFSRRLGGRVKRMVEFSQQVAQGSFPQNFFADRGKDELSLLERNLSEMSVRIREKIREIVGEKEKVDAILRCMIEGLLVVDIRGRVLLLNDQAQKIFRLPSTRDLYGASFMEVSRHPEMKKLIEEVLACDWSRECFSKEISLEEGLWVHVNAVSLREADEKPLGYILVFHDITEIKRLEAVRADFVANVSHELRTPLTAIRGYVETLLRTPPADPKDAAQFLEVIERHAERLARLTDDLLTLSDLESGRVELARQPVEARDLIPRALEVFQDRAAKKAVEVSYEVEPNLPALFGDPDRMQQLLINLVDNAIKYTPGGGVVRIRASQPVSWGNLDGAMVELTVSDTGCGIPEKDLPRLTERFYRVDRARSRELGGTGLGLAIVKHIVQAHGGRMSIESKLQKGTTVRVLLPAASTPKSLQGVLFLCTANSCRSQMAEGFAQALAPQDLNVYSAGTAPRQVHPLAVRVMREAGVDISRQRSKSIEEVPLQQIDLVITLCGEAAESCPAFPENTRRLHWPLPDPALAQGNAEEVLRVFREVRDEIRGRVESLLGQSREKQRQLSYFDV